MSPRTGPKHSVWCNHEPARTPDLLPQRGRWIVGRAQAQALGGVDQLTPEPRRGVHTADADPEACRRALLAGVAEGRADRVVCRKIEVGIGHCDDRVLARSLSKEWVFRCQPPKEPSRFARTRQD